MTVFGSLIRPGQFNYLPDLDYSSDMIQNPPAPDLPQKMFSIFPDFLSSLMLYRLSVHCTQLSDRQPVHRL